MTPQSQALMPLAEEATRLLKAFAHPARLMICCQLRDGEMSVGQIETVLGIRQPRLSRELSKLREEGLVETRRESKVIFYRLAGGDRVITLLDSICSAMLGKTVCESEARQNPATTAARPVKAGRPNPPGGYGVFARTPS